MSFVSELRSELVAAAEREETRRLPRIERPGPRLVLTAVAAAALALIVILAVSALDTRPLQQDRRPAATPTPEARDLFGGTLQPNVLYRTRAFVPTLSFEVADDKWLAEDTSLADELRLSRVHRGGPEPGAPRIRELVFSRVSEVADPSIRGLQASRIPAPVDLHAWLADHPDLRVGPARPVTVANVPGEQFDVQARFDRPAHADPWCAQRSVEPCTHIAPGLMLLDGMRWRMTVLRTEPQPLVITIFGMSEADVAAVEKAATPLLDSLRIGVR
jgi:hypothetical protein